MNKTEHNHEFRRRLNKAAEECSELAAELLKTSNKCFTNVSVDSTRKIWCEYKDVKKQMKLLKISLDKASQPQ